MKRKIKSWLPVFSGFYDNVYWEPDFEYEAEHFRETYGYIKNDLWKHFENRQWETAIAKALCSEMEDQLAEFVSGIHLEKVSSPKEYNFTNDAIHCIIIPKKKVIKTYLNTHKEAFLMYIKDRYTSYDGFMSFYSNDGTEWLNEINDCLVDDHKLGAILQFICANEDIKEEDLYYKLNDRSVLYVGEYFTNEFYKKMEAVPEFVRQNYIKEDLLSLMYQEFDPKEFDLDYIMLKTMGEIESHVLTLQFPKEKKK